MHQLVSPSVQALSTGHAAHELLARRRPSAMRQIVCAAVLCSLIGTVFLLVAEYLNAKYLLIVEPNSAEWKELAAERPVETIRGLGFDQLLVSWQGRGASALQISRVGLGESATYRLDEQLLDDVSNPFRYENVDDRVSVFGGLGAVLSSGYLYFFDGSGWRKLADTKQLPEVKRFSLNNNEVQVLDEKGGLYRIGVRAHSAPVEIPFREDSESLKQTFTSGDGKHYVYGTDLWTEEAGAWKKVAQLSQPAKYLGEHAGRFMFIGPGDRGTDSDVMEVDPLTGAIQQHPSAFPSSQCGRFRSIDGSRVHSIVCDGQLLRWDGIRFEQDATVPQLPKEFKQLQEVVRLEDGRIVAAVTRDRGQLESLRQLGRWMPLLLLLLLLPLQFSVRNIAEGNDRAWKAVIASRPFVRDLAQAALPSAKRRWADFGVALAVLAGVLLFVLPVVLVIADPLIDGAVSVMAWAGRFAWWGSILFLPVFILSLIGSLVLGLIVLIGLPYYLCSIRPLGKGQYATALQRTAIYAAVCPGIGRLTRTETLLLVGDTEQAASLLDQRIELVQAVKGEKGEKAGEPQHEDVGSLGRLVALLLVRNGKIDQAKFLYGELMNCSGDIFELCGDFAELHLREARNSDMALALIAYCERDVNAFLSERRLPFLRWHWNRVMGLKAWALAQTRDFPQAEATIEAALNRKGKRHQPVRAANLVIAGRIAGLQRNTRLAVSYYEQAAALDPDGIAGGEARRLIAEVAS